MSGDDNAPSPPAPAPEAAPSAPAASTPEASSSTLPPPPPASATPAYPIPPTATTQPASPSSLPMATAATTASAAALSRTGPPPPIHHLSAPPVPVAPSALPRQLKRLAYIVSLVLGGSAVVAGVWSIFLLPLLHATYSARNAVAAAQKDRWQSIMDKISSVRALGIFPTPAEEEDRLVLHRTPSAGSDKKDKTKTQELALQRTRTPDSPRSATISVSHTEPEPAEPPRLHADTSSLSPALRELADCLDATSTTRTSLLSTLEGYTSGLHRELYLARGSSAATNPWGPVPGASSSRVGLNTLSANLAKAGGAVDSTNAPSLPPARSEEWDSVRREIRAIKGLLLNRRNFVRTT